MSRPVAPLLKLPIDPSLPKILASLEENPCLILQAEPGSGKTTRVPPSLLRSAFAGAKGEILVLEPRRLAAKLAATRVAEEMNEAVGATVGYQFRFENRICASTRLRFLTEGMLMRRLLSDPDLQGVKAVVLDEFHERHLHGDLALALLRRLREKRPELRLVLMSATLDVAAISEFMGGAQVIQVPGRRFEVKMSYLPEAGKKPIELGVRDAVRLALEAPREESGDLLVFLPGMADIRRTESALAELALSERLLVVPLHGELSREEQDLALGPSERRKVILATNVAESSVTIAGVSTVIDSGLARVASYSHWSGLPALRTRPVSRASAIQRAGRAGREREGYCYRLYGKADFEGRPAFDTPEILRADLAQPVLELMSMGVTNPRRLDWLDRPAEAAFQAAQDLLHRLGAIDAQGQVTELGRRMVGMPLHPRLSRIAIETERRGHAAAGALLVAALAEGRIEGLDLLHSFRNVASDRSVKQLRERIMAQLKPAQPKPVLPMSVAANPGVSESCARDEEQALAYSLLRGFPDRVAFRRTLGASQKIGPRREVEFVLSSGGSALGDENAFTLSSEYFVAVDVGERQAQGQARAQARVMLLAAIEPDWLLDLDQGIREVDELGWSREQERIESVSRMMYDELVISESRGRPQDEVAAARFITSRLLEPELWTGIARITDAERLRGWLERLRLLSEGMPGLGVSQPDESTIRTQLEEFALGKLSISALRDGDFMAHLQYGLPTNIMQALEQWVPEQVQLARGRRVRVNYESGKPPWIASRLQDFFGMKQGPAILAGRLPLTLHLLAPNQRAVQVTSDLAGFWERGYREVYKQLSRRYPRHSWPENPLDPPPASVR